VKDIRETLNTNAFGLKSDIAENKAYALVSAKTNNLAVKDDGHQAGWPLSFANIFPAIHFIPNT